MSRTYDRLVSLSGFDFSVYSSEHTQDRARVIAGRAARARQFLNETLGAAAEVNVVVLGPEHWAEYASFPVYGMPHTLDDRTLVVAGQGSDFWRSMTPPIDLMPPHLAHLARRIYSAPDGTIDYGPFFDLLAVHELGHLFHAQAGFRFPRLWLMELFCNLGLQCYIGSVESELRPALETLPQIVVDLGTTHYVHRSLEDLERLYTGVGGANYGWYQSQWHVAARHLYETAGVPVLQRMWQAFLGSPTFASDAALSAYLRDAIHPELARVQDEWPLFGDGK